MAPSLVQQQKSLPTCWKSQQGKPRCCGGQLTDPDLLHTALLWEKASPEENHHSAKVRIFECSTLPLTGLLSKYKLQAHSSKMQSACVHLQDSCLWYQFIKDCGKLTKISQASKIKSAGHLFFLLWGSRAKSGWAVQPLLPLKYHPFL